MNEAAPAQIVYAGPAPLEIAGLFQVNIMVPSFATNSNAYNPAIGVTSLAVSVTAPDGTMWQSFQSVAIGVAP